MRTLLQKLDTGETVLAQSPAPVAQPQHLVIRSRASVVSAGTERMLVEFGNAGWIEKARQQPEKVRQVLDKVKTDGLMPTIEAVRDKLGKPIPLGYCNAGTVIGVGEGVHGFEVGHRVVSNGPHAEVVLVPANLCAKVPEALFDNSESPEGAFRRAAFTVLGAVAMQGVRLARPTIGETFAVTGLGLVGQLAVQILRANGCRVIGIDLKPYRVKLTEQFGAVGIDLSAGTDPVSAAEELTGGRGIDAVLLTAATDSSEPVHQAAQMCRKRGRIVLVGVTGLELSRDDFYEKELSFQVSCSYGPGRYDPNYEEKGKDYPPGFVRWTAQRNFQAVLGLMAEGKLDVRPLITRTVPIDEAPEVYGELARGEAGMGTVITYPASDEERSESTVRLGGTPAHSTEPAAPVVGVIGAGSFATRTILPLLKKQGVRRKLVASRGGTHAAVAGRKFGFEEATSDAQTIMQDDEINTVFILTPHNTHAPLVCRALEAGKHVFCEKPLAITAHGLGQVKRAYEAACNEGAAPVLHVGFNRRFSPFTGKIKELLDRERGPKAFNMLVNAGHVPADHWIQDPEVGGGRIIGEACHFVDLLRFLAGSRIADVQSMAINSAASNNAPEDTATITLRFEDGSIGTVQYWANGSKKYPKERLHVFSGGKTLVLDNFRGLKGYGWPGFRSMKKWLRQDKGHENEVGRFLSAVRNEKRSLIPFDELVEVTVASLKAAGHGADS